MGIGTILIPDINTTAAPRAGSSHVDYVVLNSTLLSQHGEAPSDLHFQAPAKRGRPRGSKSKRGAGKASASRLEGGDLKMGRGRKRVSSMITIDPVEPTESSGIGKRLKGDNDDEIVVPV